MNRSSLSIPYIAVSGTNLGSGTGVFSAVTNNNLQYKTLAVAGTSISLVNSGSTIVISGSSGSGQSNTASNIGGGVGLFSNKVGVDLQFRTLVAGSNVSVVSSGSTVVISASTAGEANTGSNLGTGTGLFSNKVGVDLQFKSLVAGTNISLTPSSTGVTINATAATITGATNGLSTTGNKIKLGGSLTGATDVLIGTNTLRFSGTTGSALCINTGSVGVAGNFIVTSPLYCLTNKGSINLGYGTLAGTNNGAVFVAGDVNTSVCDSLFSSAIGQRVCIPINTCAVFAGGSGSTQSICGAGRGNFIWSTSNGSAVAASGVNGCANAILGGINHNIDASAISSSIIGGCNNKVLGATRSIVVGGCGNSICSGVVNSTILAGTGITLTSPTYNNFAALSNLAIFNTPPTSSCVSVLVWDVADKKVKLNSTITGGGGSPSAPINSVQYNDLGSFSGNSEFIFSASTRSLTLGGRSAGIHGVNSLSVGACNVTSQPFSATFGCNNRVCNTGAGSSFAFGTTNCSIGTNSFTFGTTNRACGANSAVLGNFTCATGDGSVALGFSTKADGLRSTVLGNYTRTVAAVSFAGGKGNPSAGTTKYITSCGYSAFNFSENNASQLGGSGANAANSAILGGLNHNINAANVRAAIIGGCTINLTGSAYIDTTAVSCLAIFQTPTTSSCTSALVWDAADKKVKLNSSLGGGGGVAGANTQVQFNNSGSFGASVSLTYDCAATLLAVPKLSISSIVPLASSGAILARDSSTNQVTSFGSYDCFAKCLTLPFNSLSISPQTTGQAISIAVPVCTSAGLNTSGINICGGPKCGNGTAGSVCIVGGFANAATGVAGDIIISGGTRLNQVSCGGHIRILSGENLGSAFNGTGGHIFMDTGVGTGIGSDAVKGSIALFTDLTLPINTNGLFGRGGNVLRIGNATCVPVSNPTGGGVLYVEAGALKWRGSSGTITTIAVA